MGSSNAATDVRTASDPDDPAPRSGAPSAGAGLPGDRKAADLLGAISEAVDRRAPGFVRFLAALRWGGLRTVRPDPFTWSVESAAALGAGLGARAGLSRLSRGRIRVPVTAAVLGGAVLAHLCVWRWDTLRWRRHRVALVVDLPLDDLVDLAVHLTAAGLPVERWERGVRSGRRVHGLWCRTGDVRAVNRSIDAATSTAALSI